MVEHSPKILESKEKATTTVIQVLLLKQTLCVLRCVTVMMA